MAGRFRWHYSRRQLNKLIVRTDTVQIGLMKHAKIKEAKAKAALARNADGRNRIGVSSGRLGAVDWQVYLYPKKSDVSALSAEEGTHSGGWGRTGTRNIDALHAAFWNTRPRRHPKRTLSGLLRRRAARRIYDARR